MGRTLAELAAQAEKNAPSQKDNPWRLRFHLEPPVGWLNDPNGLSYFGGAVHVFYQYAPFEVNGGLKQWGHFRSKDLVSWERLPIMLFSDEPYDVHGAYSGSAVPEADGLYMFYTGNVKMQGSDYDYVLTGREQNTVLAYSEDGIHVDSKTLLMTNDDYPEDMTRHVRDPKVFPYDGKYYMVLGARTKQNVGKVLVYESADKMHWKLCNVLQTETPLGYMWECPDLFEIDGQWFLVISPQGVERTGPGHENEYTCGCMPLNGDFRGEYTLGEFQPLDFGFDFYAAQSFSAPRFGGGQRRLLIGWMGMPDADYTNPTVNFGYQHCMTVLREVTRSGDRMLLNPVSELEDMRILDRTEVFSDGFSAEIPAACEIELEANGDVEIDISGMTFSVENSLAIMRIMEGGYGRTRRSAPVSDPARMRILVDTSAVEIFMDEGHTVFCVRWYPEGWTRTLRIKGGGQLRLYAMPHCADLDFTE